MGQGRCEQGSEVFVKKFFLGGGGVGSGGVGGQSRCERRSEVFVKIKKNKYFFFWGGGVGGRVGRGWGVMVHMNREV